ncbi:Imm1 family immunity protein [Streptomyces bauhiniae]|uniref:Imm1 family immunity protein n=1 Tax=Streptomyces bauhiniae TaxID=2340725 RepID=UPI0035DFCD5F
MPEDPEQFFWVTKGRVVPKVDPRVTADPGYPLWYQRRSVVPSTDVKAAILEFCHNDGRRPTIVEWEPSTPSGQPLRPE